MNNSILNLDKQEKEFSGSFRKAAQLEEDFKKHQPTQFDNNYTPLPLHRAILPSQPFPFEALGEVAGKAAKRIYEVIQAPDGMVGQSILAVLSLVSQGHVDVKIDGRIIPTSLFMVSVSESGERKSAVDKVCLKSIYDWQMALVRGHKSELAKFKNKYEVWKRKRDIAIKEASESKIDIDHFNIEEEPYPPCEGIMLCDEPTIEGLERLLERGQPSAGIFSDEGGRLIGGHALNADNALKTACGLSNLWDGKFSTKVRKGEGSKIIFGRRLAMHLMIQPIVLNEFIGNKLLMGQGLIARCLFSFPSPLAGSRKYVEIDLNKDPFVMSYYQMINSVLDRPYPKMEESTHSSFFCAGDSLNPFHVLLQGEVKKRWMEYHDQNENKIGESGIYYPIKAFASKAPDQILRIAGIFAFVEAMDHSQTTFNINLNQLNRAITLIEYYLFEALRILGQGQEDQEIQIAMKTLEWIKATRAAQLFPLSDVYQLGPPQIRKADKARKIMGILQQHDYVAEKRDVIINGAKVRSAWKLITN